MEDRLEALETIKEELEELTNELEAIFETMSYYYQTKGLDYVVYNLRAAITGGNGYISLRSIIDELRDDDSEE